MEETRFTKKEFISITKGISLFVGLPLFIYGVIDNLLFGIIGFFLFLYSAITKEDLKERFNLVTLIITLILGLAFLVYMSGALK